MSGRLRDGGAFHTGLPNIRKSDIALPPEPGHPRSSDGVEGARRASSSRTVALHTGQFECLVHAGQG